MNSLLDRFAAPLDVDALLTACSPRWGRRRGVIESIEARTATAASIRIRPGRAWAGHRAGQYVTVGVDVDGVRHQRCYSITSAPDAPDGCIEITVQAVEDGTVSRHLVHDALPGDVIALGEAAGDFTLPPTRRPILLVTAGSGITPAIGMLRTLAARSGAAPDVVVLHHAPTADRVIYGDLLADLADEHPWLRADVSLTREGGGHLDPAGLDERCPDWRDREAYVCGPVALLDFATDHWSDADLIDRLHVERFTPLTLGAAFAGNDSTGSQTTGTVTFAASGSATTSPSATTTLLAVAEDHGLVPPSGCRNGICHTCSTPLLAGCARDLRDGRLVEAGSHVQLCVSAAAGDVTLDL